MKRKMIDLKKITTFEQEASGTCGPAALRILLSYFKIEKNEKELAILCKTDAEGTRPKKMIAAMRKLGLKAKSGSGGTAEKAWEVLDYWTNQRKLPVLVDWFSATAPNFDGHYSVILGVTKDKVLMADPEFSEEKERIREMSWINFLKSWLDWTGDYIKTPKDIRLRWWAVAYRDEENKVKK